MPGPEKRPGETIVEPPNIATRIIKERARRVFEITGWALTAHRKWSAARG